MTISQPTPTVICDRCGTTADAVKQRGSMGSSSDSFVAPGAWLRDNRTSRSADLCPDCVLDREEADIAFMGNESFVLAPRTAR